MPLTDLQKEVAAILAANRNPGSHLAGGAVLNRADASPRYSNDLDLFHDAAESVALCAEADFQTLQARGYSLEWLLRQPGFYRAQLARGADTLKLEWCSDSAFRFFPVQPDELFGYCLHPADLATNKALALAGRAEIRDFLDILYLDTHCLSLGAIVWGACGKDEGFTPWSLLDMAKRHVRYREEDLASEHLARPLDLKELKEQWLSAVARAEELFPQMPAEEVGCVYLDAGNKPVTPVPGHPETAKLVRHFGSVRGAWPTIG
jgi:hypothetical protein